MMLKAVLLKKNYFSLLILLVLVSVGVCYVPVKTYAATRKYVRKLSVAETELELEEGDKESIRYKVYGAKGINKKISIKVSDKKVISAKVKGNKIIVKAYDEGQSIITVTTKAKDKKGKRCVKKILVMVENVEFDDEFEYEEEDDEQIIVDTQSDNQTTNIKNTIEQPTIEATTEMTTEAHANEITTEKSSAKTTTEKVTEGSSAKATTEISTEKSSAKATTEKVTEECTTEITTEKTTEKTTTEKSVIEQNTTEKKAEEQKKQEKKEVITPVLKYQAHVANVGWQKEVGNAQTAGTTGQSKAMEAIKITYTGFDGKNAISYNSHLANIGWQGWKNGGEISGTTGESRQMEAIQIKLNATMSKYYDIYYRMHVQDKGWLGWAANGEPAGTVYGGLRAEAIQIRIVTKGSKFERNGTAYYELPPASTIDGNTVANIAKKEVGYVAGSGNNNKYGSYFGHNNTNWCAYFVAWCMKSAGVPSNIYNYSSSNLGYAVPNENVKSGKWHHGKGFAPKAGDLIYVDWCGKCYYPEHVELVTGCSNNTIYTVSGNSSVSGGRGVVVHTWNVNDTRIKGICGVDYSGGSSAVPRPQW